MARKVLVVDDEPLVLDVVATMLEDLGYAVETSSTPQEALRWLGSEPDIDILVTDVNMPGLDGRKLGFPRKADAARPAGSTAVRPRPGWLWVPDHPEAFARSRPTPGVVRDTGTRCA